MRINDLSETAKLAHHLRSIREHRGLTLVVLSQRSGISRATLSRIENAEVSPTAETLGRLASIYALPISQLLTPLEQSFQPLVTHGDQSIWKDPECNFIRRSVSPSNGQLSVEIVECQLGEGQTIAYDAPAIPGQEHHIYILSGQIEITVEGTPHFLKAGDCLRYVLFGKTTFKTIDKPCTYVIALL